MKRLQPVVLLLALCAAGAQQAAAITRPQLDVTYVGVNGANNEWQVSITPFNPPGSIAVELAFAIDGSTLGAAMINTVDWPNANPGLNPFRFDSITFGLQIEPSNDKFYISYGSGILDAGPSELFKFNTVGNGPTTIRYGLAASGRPRGGDITAEGATTYRGYTGSVTNVPEPATLVLDSLLLVGLAACRRR